MNKALVISLVLLIIGFGVFGYFNNKNNLALQREAQVERLKRFLNERRKELTLKLSGQVNENKSSKNNGGFKTKDYDKEDDQVGTELSSLPIIVSGGGKQTAFFNEFAREDDGIIFAYTSLEANLDTHLSMIDQVNKGRIIQNVPSWHAASEHIPKVANKIDAINYDLEMWDQSLDEWKDIAYASEKMSQVASNNGLVYEAHLSRRLANEPGNIEAMIKLADVYSIAIYPCLEQYSVSECTDMHIDLINQVKSANSSIMVIMSVSVEKQIELDQHINLIDSLKDSIDGVAIFSYPNRSASVEKVKQLVGMLRDI